VYDKNCDLFVSFDKDFNFQLLGTAEADSYIAVGLSLEDNMVYYVSNQYGQRIISGLRTLKRIIMFN